MVAKVGLDVAMAVVLRVVYHTGMQVYLVNLAVEVETEVQRVLLLAVVS